MTTRVLIAVPEDSHGHGVLVSTCTPNRAPGEHTHKIHVPVGSTVEFNVWNGQALHVEEI